MLKQLPLLETSLDLLSRDMNGYIKGHGSTDKKGQVFVYGNHHKCKVTPQGVSVHNECQKMLITCYLTLGISLNPFYSSKLWDATAWPPTPSYKVKELQQETLALQNQAHRSTPCVRQDTCHSVF